MFGLVCVAQPWLTSSPDPTPGTGSKCCINLVVGEEAGGNHVGGREHPERDYLPKLGSTPRSITRRWVLIAIPVRKTSTAIAVFPFRYICVPRISSRNFPRLGDKAFHDCRAQSGEIVSILRNYACSIP